ncbi:methyltransferase small [Cellulomonas flavigena DSM 20109]|uniref:Methyltransferase small n=1 Tax=Cellulomonas flavigena (strain ATCC 482 / DSM 20109 / BCRC 11376 / JCM 18109 / NBRC 3775 / NCIMB 8073 / NRS 134) TaxID=446466 RepID=D5UJK5_CELFN|nr:methyltransferase [Cellulomonas flavigena]ADG75643.1 methyltransferase small [Cellulomonas flavigena DSM 20109]
MSTPPAPVVVPELVDALRADLAAAAYGVEHVDDLLGEVAVGALGRGEALPALRATAPGTAAGGDPAAVLARAFLLGEPVSAAALAAALPRTGVEGARRLGLVDGTPVGDVRAVVDLRPYAATDGAGEAAWWIASDLGELVTGAALRTDHVLGVGGASLTLAQATVRDPRERVLDLGTGCGVQALHASRHAAHVVATDLSPRALAFARFTTALAGLGPDRVSLREGSMLEPVAGETFDLVVSNPPFVITPRGADVPAYDYRDGGRSGDDLVRDLVTGVGDVLAPGGVAQLLANWEVRDGEEWHERIGAWVDASGLDAWVVLRDQQDPAQYAETWIRDGGTTPADRATWHARYGAWLDDLASRDVASVGFGVVTLRRPVTGRPTLRRLEQQTGPVRQPLGPVLAAGLAAHDAVTALPDDALADLRLTVAPDVTEERYLQPGAADPRVVLLRQGGGFGRAVQAGTALAAFVGACDGELTAGQIVGALGALLDVPAGDVAADVLPTVRGLLTDGLLLLP